MWHSTFLTFCRWRKEILRSNYNLGESFIKEVNKLSGFENKDGGIWLSKEKIDGKVIISKFLNKYNFVNQNDDISGPSLDAKAMISYIKRQDDGSIFVIHFHWPNQTPLINLLKSVNISFNDFW